MEIDIHAPGKARTPDLRISLLVLNHKDDVLTDRATGAVVLGSISLGYHICKETSILIKRRSLFNQL